MDLPATWIISFHPGPRTLRVFRPHLAIDAGFSGFVRRTCKDNPMPIFAFLPLMKVLLLSWVTTSIREIRGVSQENLVKCFVNPELANGALDS